MPFSPDLSSSKDVMRTSSGHLTDHLVGCGIDDGSEAGDEAANKEDSAMEPAKPTSPLRSPVKGSVQLEEKPSTPIGRGKVPLKDVGDLKDLRSAGVDGELVISPKAEFSAIERCGRSTMDSDSSK